jgi:hypothetical protein
MTATHLGIIGLSLLAIGCSGSGNSTAGGGGTYDLDVLFDMSISGTLAVRSYGPGDISILSLLGVDDTTTGSAWSCTGAPGSMGQTVACPSFAMNITSVDPPPPSTSLPISNTHGTIDVTLPGATTAALTAHVVF